MLKQKGIFLPILGVILLLLIAGAAVYLAVNKNRETQTFPAITNPNASPKENAVSSSHKIAYVLNGDLWTVNSDGSSEKKLTDYGYNKNPVWSHDGSKIAYQSSPQSVVNKGKDYANCTDYNNIWIINADGTDPIQVTNSEAMRSIPSWSPDGSKIVYVENNNVVIYSLEDKAKKTIATNAYYDENPNKCRIAGGGGQSNATWNPRNNTILFNPDYIKDYSANLIDENGEVIKKLSSYGIWSPDGTKIAFVKYDFDNDNKQTIVVQSIENLEETTYIPFNNSSSSLYWSPDGNSLLYTGFEDSYFGVPPIKMGTVRVLNLITGDDRNISDSTVKRFIDQRKDSGMQEGGAFGYGWSPDGNFIIIDVNTEEHKPQYAGVNQINIINPRTRDFVRTIKEVRRTGSSGSEDWGYITGVSWSPK